MKSQMDIPDGLISLDSNFATYYGFTSENYYEESYLVGDSLLKQITIPMLISNHPGEGLFSKAVKMMLKDGVRVSFPTPVPEMQEILTAWGFQIVWVPEEGIEYWVYPPFEAEIE
jgi:hypothetical protein